MPSILATVNLFAGLSWTPGVRGILVVATGVAVLCGSVYLLLGTNVGARLGMLLALTGLFGWLVILTLYWWITPPAIGPRGRNNSWQVAEIYVNGTELPRTQAAQTLPHPDQLPTPQEILADNQAALEANDESPLAGVDLSKEYPNGFTLSDLQANQPDLLKTIIPADELNGWKVVPSSAAGEAQAAADVALVNSGIFSATGDYKKLSVFTYGGKETRQDACSDGDMLCRAWYRITKALTIKHPTHYAVVQVQKVVPQEAVAGEAPPIPKADPNQPVISVVMVRDLGNVRLIPFLYFVISLALFVLFAWILHNRDKTLAKNKAAAEAALKGA